MSKILSQNDLVVEIGSNIATSLSFFPNNCRIIGVDPSARPLQKSLSKTFRTNSRFFSIYCPKNFKDRR